MIVVDTNVIINLWLLGQYNKQAERLITNDSEWAVPILWRSEFRSIMSLYLRKKLLTIEKALTIIDFAEEQLNDNEFYVSSRDVMELTVSSKCSAYDCEIAALAKYLNIKLVTSDKQLLIEFPSIIIPLAKF